MLANRERKRYIPAMSFFVAPYWVYLTGLSLLFVLLERLRPWRQQALLRPGLLRDFLFLVFSGHVLWLLLAPGAAWLSARVEGLLVPFTGAAHLATLPLATQALVAFFAVDFMQWSVHNLLHRVPWLWSLHKVHHSIVLMDWIGSLRFHWIEVVVYKSLQFVPLLLMGFDARVLSALAIFSTAIGHFNHANLRVPMGPLRYLLNHPGMHIWHHDHQLHGRAGCNFGINLSLWDWIFGTAYMPDEPEQPQRLGFEGIEHFPQDFVRAQLWPLSALLARRDVG